MAPQRYLPQPNYGTGPERDFGFGQFAPLPPLAPPPPGGGQQLPEDVGLVGLPSPTITGQSAFAQALGGVGGGGGFGGGGIAGGGLSGVGGGSITGGATATAGGQGQDSLGTPGFDEQGNPIDQSGPFGFDAPTQGQDPFANGFEGFGQSMSQGGANALSAIAGGIVPGANLGVDAAFGKSVTPGDIGRAGFSLAGRAMGLTPGIGMVAGPAISTALDGYAAQSAIDSHNKGMEGVTQQGAPLAGIDPVTGLTVGDYAQSFAHDSIFGSLANAISGIFGGKDVTMGMEDLAQAHYDGQRDQMEMGRGIDQVTGLATTDPAAMGPAGATHGSLASMGFDISPGSWAVDEAEMSRGAALADFGMTAEEAAAIGFGAPVSQEQAAITAAEISALDLAEGITPVSTNSDFDSIATPGQDAEYDGIAVTADEIAQEQGFESVGESFAAGGWDTFDSIETAEDPTSAPTAADTAADLAAGITPTEEEEEEEAEDPESGPTQGEDPDPGGDLAAAAAEAMAAEDEEGEEDAETSTGTEGEEGEESESEEGDSESDTTDDETDDEGDTGGGEGEGSGGEGEGAGGADGSDSSGGGSTSGGDDTADDDGGDDGGWHDGGIVTKKDGGDGKGKKLGKGEVDATLQTKEYVMQREAVKKYGKSVMDKINSGQISTAAMRKLTKGTKKRGGSVESRPANKKAVQDRVDQQYKR